LRQRVDDIATGSGQYDVMTIGTLRGSDHKCQDWLLSLNDLPRWDKDDLLPAIASGFCRSTEELYAAPFMVNRRGDVPHRSDGSRRAGNA
jgi:hypothetical protein